MAITHNVPVFAVGRTAHLHPASDWFMRGVKTATVTKLGRKWVHFRVSTPGLVSATFRISWANVNAHVERVSE